MTRVANATTSSEKHDEIEIVDSTHRLANSEHPFAAHPLGDVIEKLGRRLFDEMEPAAPGDTDET